MPRTSDRFCAWLAGMLFLAALSIIPLSGSGCGRGAQEEGKGEKAVRVEGGRRLGGRIIIGTQQEPEMLSEILNSMAATNMVCNLIFSKFVKYDDSLRLLPDLIEEIPSRENGGISQDYLTFTYRIRPDAYWHDGQPVTSRDVAFTYEVIMDPEVNIESREGWEEIDRLETPDEKTVVFHLKRPFPDFVSEIFYDESVLPEHILGDQRGRAFQASPFHHAPVGSGPFKFKEWVPGSHLTVVKNETYYGEGPYLDEVIFKFVPDMNTLLVQLQAGEIDLFDNADTQFLAQLSRMAGIKVYKTPTLMYEHLDLNTENPILADKRIRRALAYATNKEEIARKIYNGVVKIAHLDEFPSSPYYSLEAAALDAYNPKEARRLLAEAGWRDSDGDGIREKEGRKLRLTITSTSGQLNRERTEILLMNQYRKVGIELTIKNYNPTVLYGTYQDGGILMQGRFDIAMYAWLSSPEPARKVALYASHSIPPRGQNHTRIALPELTDLLMKASNEVDRAVRVGLYKQVAKILVDESPVIPLFWYTAVDAATEKLANFRPNPTQSADTWNANEWYLLP